MAQSIATSDQATGFRDALLSGMRATGAAIIRKFSSLREEVRDRIDSRIAADIDVDRVVRSLHVETRARADGEAGQPLPTEESASGTQREIIAHFRSLQRRAQRKATGIAERTGDFGNEIDLSEAVAEVRDIPARCETELLRLIAKFGPEIESARRKALDAQQEGDNGDVNAGSAKAWHGESSSLGYSLLAVLLIFGGAFMLSNLAAASVVYAPESWSVVAMVISVIVPFVITRELLRSADLQRRQHRIMATTGIALSVVFITVTSVIVAALVSASLAGGSPGVMDILNAFASPATGLAVVAEGWVSAAIVVVAGMLAVGMGHRSVEVTAPSPARASEVANEINPSRVLIARLTSRCNRIIDRAHDELLAKSGRFKKRIRQYARMVEGTRSIPDDLAAYDVALEDACNIVLDRYRAANREVRDCDDPPSFSAYICFRPEESLHSHTFDQAESIREDLQQSLKKLDGEIAQAKQKLRELNARSLTSIDEQ